ncbi:MAG: hypothetical protein ACRD1H_13390, partial [Vicinamibacterales bacterium]
MKSPHSIEEASRLVTEQTGGASLDKVRDILFGVQIRDYDRRFARLEERLAKETVDLKDEVKKRLDALEGFMKSETESLADRLKVEREEREESVANSSRKASLLEEQSSKSQRDLRQQILDQHQRLSDEIRLKVEDVLATLARESDSLRSEKTDRAALASLFNEMAMRLTDELRIPIT